MTKARPLIKEIIAKSDLSKDHKIAQAHLLEKFLNGHALPADALNIDENTFEYLYDLAYQLYHKGKYKESLALFQILFNLDPTQPRLLTGTASCWHQMGHLKDAIGAYYAAAFLDPIDPIPLFHMADCLIKLKSVPEAIITLQSVITRAGDNPLFAIVKGRSELMLETLKIQLETARA